MPVAAILGATGFIGGHVALAALARGWEVRGVRRAASAVGLLGLERITWYEGDLDAPRSFDAALRGVDVVFHVAAYYPKDARAVTRHVAQAVQQIRNVLEAVERVGSPKLVYTSSLSTVGRPPLGEQRPADERDVYRPGTLPRSAYYEAKIAMETEVMRTGASGRPILVVNPTVVFGPGDARPTIGAVLIALARGYGIVSLPGWLNVVDVCDVAQGHLLAAQVGRPGQRYILGGTNITVRELMEQVAHLAHVPPPRAEVPAGVFRMLVRVLERIPGAAAAASHLMAFEHWRPLDSRRADRELGYRARPLRDTLADALHWYEAHGMLRRRGLWYDGARG